MKVIGMKIRMFLFSMLLLAGNLVMGQATILMPVSGHKDTTLTSCVLYDDGGATGNHSAHTNASYTFHTTNSNNRFRITVNSYLNNCNEGLASLKIYCVDTINNDSTLLDGWVFACNMAWFTYSTTNVITVVFKADDDNAQQGFQIKIDEAGCEPATNVTATFTDTNTAVITWDEPSEDIHWVIDYTTYFIGEDAHLNMANSDSLHTVYSDTNYVVISGVDAHSYYSFNVYSACDSYSGKGIGRLVGNCRVDSAESMYIVGDDAVCYGQSMELSTNDNGLVVRYLWNTGDTTQRVTITPAIGDSLYSCTLTFVGGCHISLDKYVNVNASYNDTITADICDGETFDSLNFHENQSGVYQFHLYTSEGCDSVTTLLLTVHPQYDTTLSISTCDTDYVDENFYMSQTGVYTHTFASEHGCDSVVTINFTRLDVFKDTIKAEIYKGDTFTAYGFEAYESGTYEQVYQDTNGCDSTYILDLKVVDFHFPNVVTPNGDGVNDVYDIHDLVEQQMFSYTVLRIYNRYGKLIFEKENIHSAEDRWDPDETNSPSGTYFYRFNARSNTKTIDVTGTIEVLREK